MNTRDTEIRPTLIPNNQKCKYRWPTLHHASFNLPNHRAQFLNDLESVLLNAYRSRVATRMRIHRAYNRRYRWFLIITRWWMGDIRSQENDGFVEYLKQIPHYINTITTGLHNSTKMDSSLFVPSV